MSEPFFVKHTVSTDALETLGTIIGPEEKRDAIHLAVFPVEAGEMLQPGAHVFLMGDGMAYRAPKGKGLGIVDPFLAAPVRTDERFWLVVYPRQISSLRHVWEHPEFPPSGETEALLVDPLQRYGERDRAEKWLREFAGNMGAEMDALVSAATTGHQFGSDEYLVVYDSDAHGDIPESFWEAMEAYTGQKMDRSAKYFSCSC